MREMLKGQHSATSLDWKIYMLGSVVDPNSFFSDSDSDPQIIFFGFGFGFLD
jgi:hypothetical protein